MNAAAEIAYRPFNRQRAFHLSPARVKVAVAGSRGGKTKCGAHEVVDKAILQPGYTPEQIRNGEDYTIVVGSRLYSLVDRVAMPNIVRSIPRDLIVEHYSSSRHTMRIRGTKGFTRIWVMHGDPRSWVSWNANGAWLDEFAQCKEEVFNEAMTRVSNNRGWIVLTGTPCGPNWAFERLYQPWAKEGNPNGIHFDTWTTADNPYFPRDELERKRREMPPRYFARSFLASWDTFQGQCWDELVREVHVRALADYTFLLPNGRRVGSGKKVVSLEIVVGGIDWGFGNPGAIILCGKAKGRWYVLHERVDTGVPTVAAQGDCWLARALAMRQDWGVHTFWCDPENKEAIAAFCNAGLEARPANNAVVAGIETVAKFIHCDEVSTEPKLVILDCCKTTIDEVFFYHWKEGSAKEQPEKVRDHTCDAMRYAIHSQETRGTFDPQGTYDPGRSGTVAQYARL